MCLNGPLGMKRGRGMRQEYSTTGARKQEAQCFRGLFTNRFLGEWTYILGLGAGRCRGVGRDAGARFGRAEADARLPKRAALKRTRLWPLSRAFVGIFVGTFPLIPKDPLQTLVLWILVPHPPPFPFTPE